MQIRYTLGSELLNAAKLPPSMSGVGGSAHQATHEAQVPGQILLNHV